VKFALEQMPFSFSETERPRLNYAGLIAIGSSAVETEHLDEVGALPSEGHDGRTVYFWCL
jgi:hypothetical protein